MAVHYSDIRLLLTVELKHVTIIYVCLLYTSDAADEL